MKILLDTNILLWAAAGELSPAAERYVADTENELLFSSASLWEVAIKRELGRRDFTVEPALLYSGLLRAGYKELPVTGKHALRVGALPPLHKDPFDRILLAQSAAEGASLLTSDAVLSRYPGSVIWIAP
jgi:PIN domain nuclease of toxin-antitoxin system